MFNNSFPLSCVLFFNLFVPYARLSFIDNQGSSFPRSIQSMKTNKSPLGENVYNDISFGPSRARLPSISFPQSDEN